MKKKNVYSVVIFIITIAGALSLLAMYKFGVFHNMQSWTESTFIGKDIGRLDTYLKSKNINLDNVTASEDEIFKSLSGKKLSSKQTLYRFWGGREHTFWYFPLGTKTYGMFVLVENGKIIFFKNVFVLILYKIVFTPEFVSYLAF